MPIKRFLDTHEALKAHYLVWGELVKENHHYDAAFEQVKLGKENPNRAFFLLLLRRTLQSEAKRAR